MLNLTLSLFKIICRRGLLTIYMANLVSNSFFFVVAFEVFPCAFLSFFFKKVPLKKKKGKEGYWNFRRSSVSVLKDSLKCLKELWCRLVYSYHIWLIAIYFRRKVVHCPVPFMTVFFFKHRSSSLIGYISLCISFSVSLISFHTLLVLPFLVGKWFKDELLWCHYSWTLEQHWSYLQTLSIFNNIVSWFSKFRSLQEWNQCFLVW